MSRASLRLELEALLTSDSKFLCAVIYSVTHKGQEEIFKNQHFLNMNFLHGDARLYYATRESAIHAIEDIRKFMKQKDFAVLYRQKSVHPLKAIEVLECYVNSFAAENKDAYCSRVVTTYKDQLGLVEINPDGIMGVKVNPLAGLTTKLEYFNFPCALLKKKFINETGSPYSLQDRFQAQGVEHDCILCPNFKSANFRQLAELPALNPIRVQSQEVSSLESQPGIESDDRPRLLHD